MDTAGKLKSYMKQHNLKQWELAQRLKVPERTLSRWLNGKAKMSPAYQRVLEGMI